MFKQKDIFLLRFLSCGLLCFLSAAILVASSWGLQHFRIFLENVFITFGFRDTALAIADIYFATIENERIFDIVMNTILVVFFTAALSVSIYAIANMVFTKANKIPSWAYALFVSFIIFSFASYVVYGWQLYLYQEGHITNLWMGIFRYTILNLARVALAWILAVLFIMKKRIVI